MIEDNPKLAEVQANYRAFEKRLPGLLSSHSGKFALLRNGEIVEFFDTPRDAMLHGQHQYNDGLYSVQEVTARVVDLGWFSHAPVDTAI